MASCLSLGRHKRRQPENPPTSGSRCALGASAVVRLASRDHSQGRVRRRYGNALGYRNLGTYSVIRTARRLEEKGTSALFSAWRRTAKGLMGPDPHARRRETGKLAAGEEAMRKRANPTVNSWRNFV